MRAGRIVVPIPPGVSWREAGVPVVNKDDGGGMKDEEKTHGRAARGTGKKKVVETVPQVAVKQAGAQVLGMGNRGFRFRVVKVAMVEEVGTVPVVKEKKKRQQKKIDPAMIARARELRDRWMEAVNAGQANVALPMAKYEVGRAVGDTPTVAKQIAA